jgi:uncharacterized protein YeaO (DUF488 family)
VEVRRVYDYSGRKPGEAPYLVDRLWPRGVPKKALGDAEWARDIAPSEALRRWYGHDPGRFEEFKRRYLKELSAPEKKKRLDELLVLSRRERVVLLTATRDVSISAASVLKELLESLLAR